MKDNQEEVINIQKFKHTSFQQKNINQPQPIISQESNLKSQFLQQYLNWFEIQQQNPQAFQQMLNKQQIKELEVHDIVFDKKKLRKQNFHIKYFSKYGSITVMIVELGYFILNLKILNKPMNKEFYGQHNQNIQFAGNFGRIQNLKIYNTDQLKRQTQYQQTFYKVSQQNFKNINTICEQRQFVSKSIVFQKKIYQQQQHQYQYSQILTVIKQYCIFKIASVLKLSVGLDPIIKFDLIFYKDSIEFFMQKGQSIFKYPQFKYKQVQASLKRQLQLFHQLRILHNDIKIENLIYSKKHKKVVFIDFGLSQISVTKIGIKSLTKFKGSFYNASNEMKLLIHNNTDYIDLYWNDAVCLINTLKMLQTTLYVVEQSDLKSKKLQQSLQNIKYSDNLNQAKLLQKLNHFYCQKNQICAQFTGNKVVKQLNTDTLLNTIIFKCYSLYFLLIRDKFIQFYDTMEKFNKQISIFKILKSIYTQFLFMNLVLPFIEQFRSMPTYQQLFKDNYAYCYRFINEQVKSDQIQQSYRLFNHKIYIQFFLFFDELDKKSKLMKKIKQRYNQNDISYILETQQQEIRRDKFYLEFLIVEKNIIDINYKYFNQKKQNFVDFSHLINANATIDIQTKQNIIHLFIIMLISLYLNKKKCMRLIQRFIRRFKAYFVQFLQTIYDPNDLNISHQRRHQFSLKNKMFTYINNQQMKLNNNSSIYPHQTQEQYEVFLNFDQNSNFELKYQRKQIKIERQLFFIVLKMLHQKLFIQCHNGLLQQKFKLYFKLWDVLEQQGTCFKLYTVQQLLIYLFLFNYLECKQMQQVHQFNKLLLKFYSQQKRIKLYYHNLLLIGNIIGSCYTDLYQCLQQLQPYFKNQENHQLNQNQLFYMNTVFSFLQSKQCYYSSQQELYMLKLHLKRGIFISRDQVYDIIPYFNQACISIKKQSLKKQSRHNLQNFFKLKSLVYKFLDSYQEEYDLIKNSFSTFSLYLQYSSHPLNRNLNLSYHHLGLNQDFKQITQAGSQFSRYLNLDIYFTIKNFGVDIAQERQTIFKDHIFKSYDHFTVKTFFCHRQYNFKLKIMLYIIEFMHFKLCSKKIRNKTSIRNIFVFIKKLYIQRSISRSIQQFYNQSLIMLDDILTVIIQYGFNQTNKQFMLYFFQEYEKIIFIIFQSKKVYPALYWIAKVQYEGLKSRKSLKDVYNQVLSNLQTYSNVQKSPVYLKFIYRSYFNNFQQAYDKDQLLIVNKYAKILVNALKATKKSFRFLREPQLCQKLLSTFHKCKQFQYIAFVIRQITAFISRLGGQINFKDFQAICLKYQYLNKKQAQIYKVIEFLNINDLENQPSIAIFIVSCLKIVISQKQNIFQYNKIQRLFKAAQICYKKIKYNFVQDSLSRYIRLAALWHKYKQNYIKLNYLNIKCLRKQSNEDKYQKQKRYNSYKWKQQNYLLKRISSVLNQLFNIKLKKLDQINF